jgi:hypothetical protein
VVSESNNTSNAASGCAALIVGAVFIGAMINNAVCGRPSTPSPEPISYKSISDELAENRRREKETAIAATSDRIAQAKRVLREKSASLLDFISARDNLANSRYALPSGAPELKEINRLLAQLDARIKPLVEARVRSESKSKTTDKSDDVGGTYFSDTPGIHKTPAGRFYSVEVEYDGDKKVYTYDGCIEGQVVTKNDRIVYDSRTFDD